MGRLIDADALIERIKEHQKNVGSVAGGVAGELYNVAHGHFVDIVNNQPTAFNKDAVLWVLKILQDSFEDDEVISAIMRNVIDIVKKGGVNIVRKGGVNIVRKGGVDIVRKGGVDG